MYSVITRVQSRIHQVTLWNAITTPLRARTYGILLYHLLAFPLGLGYFLFLSISLPLSAFSSVILIGIPGLLVVLFFSVGLIMFERRLTQTLLGVRLHPPNWTFHSKNGLPSKIKHLVLDPALWLGIVFLASKLIVGLISLSVLALTVIPAIALLVTPLYYQTPGIRVGLFLPETISQELSLYIPWDELLVGVSYVIQVSSWQVNSIWDAIFVSVIGLVLLAISLAILNVIGWAFGQYSRYMLGGEVL